MTEAQARESVVYYCALLWQRRLVSGSSGNVSVRLESGDILVTPTLRSLRELHPHELVLTDAHGAAHSSGRRPTSELPLHVAAYAARPDIRSVIHTHPTFCVVCSKLGRVFERDTVGARESLGIVTWTPYRDPGSQELAQITAHELAAGAEAVLMERHGLTAVADTLERAFVITDLCEEAARIGFYSLLL